MTTAFDVVLPPEASSAPAARRVVRGLSDVLDPLVVEDLALLVTELVGNSVRHAHTGGEEIEVHLRTSDDRVVVEVIDHGTRFMPVPPAHRMQGSGWGLFLVDRIADRWGIIRDDGTVAWFEIDVVRRPDEKVLSRRVPGIRRTAKEEEGSVGPSDGANPEEATMGEKMDEAKGRVKEAVADLTDDERLEREGKVDRAGAKAKEKARELIEKGKETATKVWEEVDDAKDPDGGGDAS